MASLVTPLNGWAIPGVFVRYNTEYLTFDTVDKILFSIPILNKSEASIQDKHVDNIHINYSKVLVQHVSEHV